jgi:hypothetical protein
MQSRPSATAAARPPRPWPADQVERWPIERLTPYANKRRLQSEGRLDKIAAAIVEWGEMLVRLANERQAFGQTLDERQTGLSPID